MTPRSPAVLALAMALAAAGGSRKDSPWSGPLTTSSAAAKRSFEEGSWPEDSCDSISSR